MSPTRLQSILPSVLAATALKPHFPAAPSPIVKLLNLDPSWIPLFRVWLRGCCFLAVQPATVRSLGDRFSEGSELCT